MSKNIELYRCVYPFNSSSYDKKLPTYNMIKKYVVSNNMPCIVYSPRDQIIATYIKDWMPIH